MTFTFLEYDGETKDIIKISILLPNEQRIDENRILSESNCEEQKDSGREIKDEDLSINLQNNIDEVMQSNDTNELKISNQDQEQEQNNQQKNEEDYEEAKELEKEKIDKVKDDEVSSWDDMLSERCINGSVSSSDESLAPNLNSELKDYLIDVIVSKLERQIKIDSGVALEKRVGRTRNNELVNTQTVYKCVRDYTIKWLNLVDSK